MNNMTRIVWLDAGHGGTDPGAVGNGLQEKNIVLDLTNRIGNYLLANYHNVNVRYTRTTDNFVDLATRSRQANNAQADVFVSVHCNSFSDPSANGYEDYIFNGTVNTNTTRLQDVMHRHLSGFYTSRGLRNRGKKRANFAVLRETNMPAILTENLFMSNSEILNFNQSTFVQSVAETHTKGIAEYLGLTASGGGSGSSQGGDRHTVTQATPGYLTAADALNSVNPRTTVQPGTYYIFNTSQGMINVTHTQATPGSWINPNDSSSSVSYYPATNPVGGSIVNTLNSIGVDSSFTNRERIARANGISNYTGTEQQNIQLLNLLQQGKLIRP